MNILCVCKEWNSRSVQFAHLLKYWGNDCISIWTSNTSQETLDFLVNDWASKIIIFEEKSVEMVNQVLLYCNKFWIYDSKKADWKIIEFFLPDEFPRPFNKELHEIAKKFLEENKNILKNT